MGHFQKLLLDKSVKFELECFEKMEYYDEFKKSKDQIEKRIEDIQETLSNFVTSILGIGAFIGLIITMEPIVIIFSFSSVLMSLFLNKKAISMQYDFYEKITPLERKVDYFLKISTDREYAKDVRMHSGFVSLIKMKFNYNLSNIIKIIKSFSKKYSYVLVFQNLIVQGVNLITVIYIVRKVFFKLISIGDFVALAGSNQRLIEYISTLFRVIPEIYEHGLYLENLFNFLEYNVKVYDGEVDYVDEKNLEIQLENVSYMYPETNVYAIENLNMKIRQGEKVAIVGENGAGKTTLCNLIARFWDVKKGEVLIGGHNVKDFTSESLLKNISMVFQKVYLFNDTIENNIKFGNPNATHDEVVEACKKACCHEFITSLSDGYDTVVGEGGSTLSGGEKQRISIARAILKDAPIIILDEATSSVDPENEYMLISAIKELTKNKTLISIAHRLSTVREADQIIVIDKGRIVQRGNHKELIGQDGVYKHFIEIKKQSIGWQI